MTGDMEDAGDALQNTMAKALKALPGETRELKLKPWLFQVAHNECINLIRARRPAEDIAEHDLAGGESLESTVANRERLRQLLSDLEHLPEQQRGALVMRELNGLSFDEIGAAIDASPGAAKQAVYEARCSLQEQAQGRDMDCETVRSKLSERDGRVSGARRIKAHLRTCEACADFRTGINARQADLRALVPPLPAALVVTITQIFGGGSGGGGGLAASIGMSGGNAVLGGSAMKATAVIAITAGLGAGTVGLVDGARDAGQPKKSPSGTSAQSVPASRLIGEAPAVGAFPPGATAADSRMTPRSMSGEKDRTVPPDPVIRTPTPKGRVAQTRSQPRVPVPSQTIPVCPGRRQGTQAAPAAPSTKEPSLRRADHRRSCRRLRPGDKLRQMLTPRGASHRVSRLRRVGLTLPGRRPTPVPRQAKRSFPSSSLPQAFLRVYLLRSPTYRYPI